MGNFAISGTGINTSGNALLGVTGSATIRGRIYDIMIGSRATPADQTCTYDVARSTTAPTTTSVTPTPLDALQPTHAASVTAWQNGASPIPTKAAILLSVSLNQRATFRWVAAPGSELLTTATTAYGIYIYALTPTTAYIVETTMLYTE